MRLSTHPRPGGDRAREEDVSRDRRKHNRREYRCPVWFARNTEALTLGTLVDLSRGGLALITGATSSHPSVGQVLRVQFSRPSQDPCMGKPIVRAGRVCRVTGNGNGSCGIAVQLDQPLSLEPSQLRAIRKEPPDQRVVLETTAVVQQCRREERQGHMLFWSGK
jgi:hypothetical protein